MENKQIILLKVVASKHENHRLQLLNKDFKKLIEGKTFKLLTIEFDDKVVIDFTKSINLYLEDGTLAQKERISGWISRNGYAENPNDALILFELTINEKNASHVYKYLGDATKLYNEIADIKNGVIL